MVAGTKWGQADRGSRRGPGGCLSGAHRKRRPCRPHPANCCGLCSLQHFSSLFWNLAPILYLLDRLGHSHYTWLPRYLVHQQVVGNSCSFVCVFGCGCEGWTSQQLACSYFVSQTQWECSTHLRPYQEKNYFFFFFTPQFLFIQEVIVSSLSVLSRKA